MLQLKNSKVQRAGVTARYWTNETSTISAKVRQGLEFCFIIASKGGGQTDICLTIDKSDLPALLKELAQTMPELAAALAESTHVAVLKGLEAAGQQ